MGCGSAAGLRGIFARDNPIMLAKIESTEFQIPRTMFSPCDFEQPSALSTVTAHDTETMLCSVQDGLRSNSASRDASAMTGAGLDHRPVRSGPR